MRNNKPHGAFCRTFWTSFRHCSMGSTVGMPRRAVKQSVTTSRDAWRAVKQSVTTSRDAWRAVKQSVTTSREAWRAVKRSAPLALIPAFKDKKGCAKCSSPWYVLKKQINNDRYEIYHIETSVLLPPPTGILYNAVFGTVRYDKDGFQNSIV